MNSELCSLHFVIWHIKVNKPESEKIKGLCTKMSQVTFQAKHFLVFDGQLGILKLRKLS